MGMDENRLGKGPGGDGAAHRTPRLPAQLAVRSSPLFAPQKA